jgi:hypothetical protein
MNLRCGRGDTLGQHLAAEQGVDECALAGVELPDHYQQEELVELGDRVCERFEVLDRHLIALERGLGFG